MTAVVGWIEKTKKKVWVGADSSCNDDDTILSVSNPKVFQVGDFLIGGCGSFRAMQLLMYSHDDIDTNLFDLIPPKRPKTLFRFMVSEFVPTIRQIYYNNDFLLDGICDEFGLLIGVNCNLFVINHDFHIDHVQDYTAIGAGYHICLGALDVCWQLDNISGDKALNIALNTASKYSNCVQGPNVILGAAYL